MSTDQDRSVYTIITGGGGEGAGFLGEDHGHSKVRARHSVGYCRFDRNREDFE